MSGSSNNNLSKSRETVRTPTNITTGTNILKLDPGIYSYEDSNASDEQKLAMGFPKAMWHSEITVTGYWADNNKSTGYINIVVRDCNGDTPCIYENLYGWTGWRGWQSYALKSDLFAYNWISNPNTCTTPFAVVNGWSHDFANAPDDAKNTWNSLQTTWVYPSEIGDLTKQRLQILITGNNTLHTRMYANGNFSNWS